MTRSESTNSESVMKTLSELRDTVIQVAACAEEAGDVELGLAADALLDLLAVAEMFSEDVGTRGRASEVIEFCETEAIPALLAPPFERAEVIRKRVEDNWGESLALLEPEERKSRPEAASTQWPSDAVEFGATASNDEPESVSSPLNMAGILAALASEPDCSVAEANDGEVSPPACKADEVASGEVDVETIDDPEMVAAFADDAQQCLAEMEASLLELETEESADESLKNFCRQLHTLKGAAGTVGLSRLASFLHELENYVETTNGDVVDVDRLLAGVDAVRTQLDAIVHPETAAPEPPRAVDNGTQSDIQRKNDRPQCEVTHKKTTFSASASAGDSELFVRVEASRLDRLMDLLAELVMLRNRRETYVDSLKDIQHELEHCASRTRTLSSSAELPVATATADDHPLNLSANRQAKQSRLTARSLDEISADTTKLSREISAVTDPLAEDNAAVSHLIGRFRQELMQLRRLPMTGLFQKLQRAIREAAKAEGKQVEIEFHGEGARAERAVQERLFEPLLHLVRNAVSHGIQSQQERQKVGKQPVGKITLTAFSDAASLSIHVQDDGCGLNEVALESRGRELGLLPWDEPVSQTQLWKLIFHPGFSTKSSVNEISGRGVGMDVVDSWVRRLRGRISVESGASQGTTIRLQVPLRSAVEHALIMRHGGQLFALPMHAVSNSSDLNLAENDTTTATENTRVMGLGDLLGYEDEPSLQRSRVTLRDVTTPEPPHNAQSCEPVAIAVDTIIGVEEVVVRSLPPLMQGNELIAGVTLSGRAETVLLLDARRLIELGMNAASQATSVPADNHGRRNHTESPNRILVVDDSIVVRTTVAKKLRELGHNVDEASNGRDAAEALRHGGYAAVVTDVDMPVMDGIELVQEIQRQPKLNSVAVTVLSSRNADSLRQELQTQRPTTVLTKPVTDETIRDILQSFNGSAALSADQR